MRNPAYTTVVLDVDSTVSGIEGIDWLAKRRGDLVAHKVASLTDEAMRGVIPLERVYAARLAAIRPRRDEVDALSRAYVDALAPECVDTVKRLRHAGVQVLLMSAGLRHALYRLSLQLGIDATDLHAVDIRFDALGAYAGFDESSVLTTSAGKRALLEKLALGRPTLMVGDGSTDLATRPAVDAFAAFTGFVRREPVVQQADVVVDSFAQLASLVLS